MTQKRIKHKFNQGERIAFDLRFAKMDTSLVLRTTLSMTEDFKICVIIATKFRYNKRKVYFGKVAIMAVDSCVILCGGASSRLKGVRGESKIFLPFGGKSLVAHNFSKMSEIFKRVFIACKGNQVDLIKKNITTCHSERSEESKNKSVNLVDSSVASLPQNDGVENDIFIIESHKIFAPIVGIISALTQLQTQKVFFIGCDCPFVSRHAIKTLCESAPNYDIVFAKDSAKIHPLIAVWSANLLPILQDSLEKGDFRLQNIINKAHSKAVEFNKSEFFNINTTENYFTALEILRESRAKILLESLTNQANHANLG